jgi:phosphoribosylformylglycinamidine synthase
VKAIVNVKLKDGVLDPQGKAVSHALDSLGFDSVKDVRIGKQIVVELDQDNRVKAQKDVELMSEKLLANTVIEDYEIEIIV